MKLLSTLTVILHSLVASGLSQILEGPFNTTRHYAVIGTNTYHYLVSEPSSSPVGTIFLLHGFPDLAYGWRYQVPYLTSLGYLVVVPDMLGYGHTNAPLDIRQFALKKMSADLAILITRVAPGQKVILGGHDWGAGLVWRAAMYYPALFKGIFGVCVPYFPPATQYVDLADQIAAGQLPTFGYQLQLRDPKIDRMLQGPGKIRQMLLALYGGRTPEGEFGFLPTKGLIFENLPRLGLSPLVNAADMDFYVRAYVKNTVRGPLSWYRTAKINFDDELPIAQAGGHRFTMPALFIAASNDTALPPSMSIGMDRYFDKLDRAEVASSHWALWQAAAAVNGNLRNWLALLG
ncbi:hypothetical protein ABW20_dc0100252 [Dactylellina cionopaga]|nr:hypothetical protein ABW20_dc0100252 [Dactylellina cionopaga]